MNQEKCIAKVNRGTAGEDKEEERRDGIHSPRMENQFNTGGGHTPSAGARRASKPQRSKIPVHEERVF